MQFGFTQIISPTNEIVMKGHKNRNNKGLVDLRIWYILYQQEEL